MLTLNLRHFENHAVIVDLSAELREDAGRIVESVSTARAALDLKAERDALVAALPESAELRRVQERLDKQRAESVQRAADESAADGAWSAAVVAGRTPTPKQLAAREAARTAAGQSREIVAALESAVSVAEHELCEAARRAVTAWRSAELRKAAAAESTALAPVEAALAANIADVIHAKNRHALLAGLTAGEWRDAQPEPVAPNNKWRIQNRPGIEGRLTAIADAKLSSFGVEMLTASTGASE